MSVRDVIFADSVVALVSLALLPLKASALDSPKPETDDEAAPEIGCGTPLLPNVAALFAFNYLTDVRLLYFVALAWHSRAAYAAQFLIPSTVGMVFAYPPDAEAYGAIPIHYSVSGVRTGEDLSSLRNSCWAR